MENRMGDGLDHEIGTIELSDGYQSHYRLWGPGTARTSSS